MNEQEYNEVIQSLRENTFHMNNTEALGVIQMYLSNEHGFKDFIINNNLNGSDSIETYLLKVTM